MKYLELLILKIEQTAGIPQLVIRPDREKLARFGISIDQVAEVVETAFKGIEVTDVYEPDRITSILIRLPEEYRRDEEALKNLLIDAPGGEKIPLSALVEIIKSEGPQTIFRENMLRRKIISCNVAKRDIAVSLMKLEKGFRKRLSSLQAILLFLAASLKASNMP